MARNKGLGRLNVDLQNLVVYREKYELEVLYLVHYSKKVYKNI